MPDETPSPSFAAPLEPDGYLRRIPLEPPEATARVTAQRDLFGLAHLGVPRVEVTAWRLEVAGLVARPVTLSLADIGDLPMRRVEPRREWSWQRFTFDWRPERRGNFTLAARASDTRGAVQPMKKARNAVHTVTVTVE
jgi:hypothetical protein